MSLLRDTYFWKMLWKCYYSVCVGYQHFMLRRVICAIAIGILEICYAMGRICVSAFLHWSTSEKFLLEKKKKQLKVFDYSRNLEQKPVASEAVKSRKTEQCSPIPMTCLTSDEILSYFDVFQNLWRYRLKSLKIEFLSLGPFFQANSFRLLSEFLTTLHDRVTVY